LNLQARRDGSVEIQANLYIVIFVETAANGFLFGDFAVRHDDDLPRYRRFELRSASGELDLRYSPFVILVQVGKLRRVPDSQRQCRLQAIRALSEREAA
jgi:hypothetical protein